MFHFTKPFLQFLKLKDDRPMQKFLSRERVRLEAAQLDIQHLQGVWTTLPGRRQAQLFITGEHFTMRFRRGDVYVGTFSVDPTQRPRAMDLRIIAGPESSVGKIALAIYQFDGEHLIWSPSLPGDPERGRGPFHTIMTWIGCCSSSSVKRGCVSKDNRDVRASA
jgi:uncharacterized protein (TIGR03067 family)